MFQFDTVSWVQTLKIGYQEAHITSLLLNVFPVQISSCTLEISAGIRDINGGQCLTITFFF